MRSRNRRQCGPKVSPACEIRSDQRSRVASIQATSWAEARETRSLANCCTQTGTTPPCGPLLQCSQDERVLRRVAAAAAVSAGAARRQPLLQHLQTKTQSRETELR